MQMFSRTTLARFSMVCVLGSVPLLAQQTTAVPGSSVAREFPVLLQQNVIAGRTAVGTKVQAKLTVATLVDGIVIPKNAVFYGEVAQSAAKSKTLPSLLAIRMDSVQWKNGSQPLKVYLTAWYYPTKVVPRGQSPVRCAATPESNLERGGCIPGPEFTRV